MKFGGYLSASRSNPIWKESPLMTTIFLLKKHKYCTSGVNYPLTNVLSEKRSKFSWNLILLVDFWYSQLEWSWKLPDLNLGSKLIKYEKEVKDKKATFHDIGDLPAYSECSVSTEKTFHFTASTSKSKPCLEALI